MTTTTTSSSNVAIQTELLSREAMKANTPKMVVSQLFHPDNLDGVPTLQKDYTVDSDLGAASGGTEGTDFTGHQEMTEGAPVQVTPTEGALDGFVLTDRTVRRRVPGFGMTTVEQVLQSGNKAALQQLLSRDVMRIVAKIMEKIETDAVAILDDASNSVGSTGVDITIANALEARYTLETLEPNREERAFVFTPNQVYELEQAFLISGETGTLWTNQADGGFINRVPDTQRNGLIGSFLRDPVYRYSHSLRLTANMAADVVGSYLVPGNDMAPDDPALGGNVGFGVMLSGYEGILWRFDVDVGLRAVEGVAVAEYAFAELDDNKHVAIITDAPA